MPLTAADIASLAQSLNQSGTAIPLTITSVSATEPMQFWVMVFFSAVGVLMMMFWGFQVFIQPALASLYVKYALWRFKSITKRHYIVIKHTQQSLFGGSMIDGSTLQAIENAISSFKGKPFDLILHTPGGVIFHAQVISRILRGYPEVIRCFVPYYAMSGGTFLALSCRELFMGNFASLGPVDPQLGSLFGGFGSAKSWDEVVRRKGRKASDASIQNAFMGKQYTRTLASQIRELLVFRIADSGKVDKAVEIMTSGSIEHGYQFAPFMLSDMGIPVKQIPNDIQKHLSVIINKPWIEGVFWG